MAEVTRNKVTGVTEVDLGGTVYLKINNEWHLTKAYGDFPTPTVNELDEIEEMYDRLMAAREEVGRAIDKASRLEQALREF